MGAALGDEQFVIARRDDLQAQFELCTPCSSQRAHEQLETWLQSHPEARGQLQVVPVWEAVAS